MKLFEMKQERADILSRIEVVTKELGRGQSSVLTTAHQVELEGLRAEVNTLDKQIRGVESKNTLSGVDIAAAFRSGHFAKPGQSEPTALRTTDGRVVSMFEKGQSIAAHMRAESAADEAVTLGETLQSMVLGGGRPEIRAALSEGSDSAGGFTVPTFLSAQLIDRLRARSVVFQAGARTIPLDTGKATTIAAILTDPAATWRAENAAVATSDMTFGAVSFVPKTLAVIVTASRELVEDSVNFDQAIQLSLTKAFASELDRVALIGSGSGSEPKGVSNVSGIGSYSMGTNGLAPTSYAPFVEALGTLQGADASDPTAVIINPRTNKELNKLVDTLGQPMRKPDSIQDLPFLVTSKLPTNETQGSSSTASRAVMGYFPDLIVGIRSDLRVELIRQNYAGNLQYGFLAYLRADVAVAHAASFCNVVGIL
jgi:HK97 family phage major capsid protein